MKTTDLFLCAVALGSLAAAAGAADDDAASRLFEKAYFLEHAEGDLAGAMALYETILADHGDAHALAPRALYRLGRCQEKKGWREKAMASFKGLVDRYPNPPQWAAKARKALARLQAEHAAVTPGVTTDRSRSELIKRLEEKVEVNFLDAPILDVLEYFATVKDIDIVAVPSLANRSADPIKVNLVLEDVSLSQALGLVANFNGLSWKRLHGAVVVGKAEELDRLSKLPWIDNGTAIDLLLAAKMMSIDFQDTPLPAVVDFFRSISGINMVITPEAQKAAGDALLSLRLSEMPLGTVLRHVLGPRGLIYRVEKDVLVIDVRRRDELTRTGALRAEIAVRSETSAHVVIRSEGKFELAPGTFVHVMRDGERVATIRLDVVTADLAMGVIESEDAEHPVVAGDRIAFD